MTTTINLDNWTDGVVFEDIEELNNKILNLATIWSLDGFKITFHESMDPTNTSDHFKIVHAYHSVKFNRRTLEIRLYGNGNEITSMSFCTTEEGDLEQAFRYFEQNADYQNTTKCFYSTIDLRNKETRIRQFSSDFSESVPINKDRVLRFLDAATLFQV